MFMNKIDLYFSGNVFAYFGIKVMLALYNELEEIIPLFLFSEFVKGQHYLCLECLAELTLETTR